MLRSEFRGGYNLKIGGRPEQTLEQLLDIPKTIAVKAQSQKVSKACTGTPTTAGLDFAARIH